MKTGIIIGLFFLITVVTCAQNPNIKQLTSTQASQMLDTSKNVTVLDVRTPEEFNAGHIKGAINIDIKQPDAFSRIDSLNKSNTYVVHCRTNHRSKVAVDHMAESGFTDIYQISDGYSGWHENGLPEEK